MELGEKRTAEWMRKNFHAEGIKRYNVELAVQHQKNEQHVSAKKQPICEDSKIRSEIQGFILKKVEQGFPPDQLYKRLCFVFGKSKYQPYKQYFKTWIMNAIEKQISGRKIEEEEKGE